MGVIIAALMGFEFVDAAVAFLAEVAVEGFAGFAGGFGLYSLMSAIPFYLSVFCEAWKRHSD